MGKAPHSPLSIARMETIQSSPGRCVCVYIYIYTHIHYICVYIYIMYI